MIPTKRGATICRRICFFNDTATPEIYTLSLPGALPIKRTSLVPGSCMRVPYSELEQPRVALRSEEHTSELQSRQYLVCRLLLEKKNSQTKRGVMIHVETVLNDVEKLSKKPKIRRAHYLT